MRGRRWEWWLLMVVVGLWVLRACVAAQAPAAPASCSYCWPAGDPDHPNCCPSTEMVVGHTPVWFTVIGDLPFDGRLPSSGAVAITECRGHLSGPDGALIRYTVNGTAPSATNGGQLFPLRTMFNMPNGYTYGPDGTAEGDTLLLWDMKQIRGFKAISANNLTTSIYWTCQL